ncbi:MULTISPECIES: hypothetical protein [Hymenobacter]|uniref:3-oxoacyl-ACP synthase n=1 Tax=Hymenobacter guriensis TaxID=2793065 RepID=A0ABS0L250_9BACT|nr:MULTISPECIES: hypothetical protein [Hymenobacter]MBG8553499.1 hypothetical protein [Hymenobacter guriensis]MCR5886241.1 GreA/GreB family elongation factor [Hymenobacter sp. J193]
MATTVLSRQQLKQALLAECLQLQQQKVHHARQAMEQVQESANEQPASGEDKFESFREACHIQRELFARRLEEAQRELQLLQRLPDRFGVGGTMGPGSVVVTNRYTYFIAISLGEIELDGQKYCAMSAFSPLFLAMASHRVGDTFSFRGQQYTIEEVF